MNINAVVCIYHVSAMHLLLYMYGCAIVALLYNQAACCVLGVSVQNIYMSSACWWDTLMLTLLIGRVYMLSTCVVAVLSIFVRISSLSWTHLRIAHFHLTYSSNILNSLLLSDPKSQDIWAANYSGGCAPEGTLIPPPHTTALHHMLGCYGYLCSY